VLGGAGFVGTGLGIGLGNGLIGTVTRIGGAGNVVAVGSRVIDVRADLTAIARFCSTAMSGAAFASCAFVGAAVLAVAVNRSWLAGPSIGRLSHCRSTRRIALDR